MGFMMTAHDVSHETSHVITFLVTLPNLDVVKVTFTFLLVKTHHEKHFEKNNS